MRNKIENSHLIQVYTSIRSIWNGDEVSIISCDIKVDKRFLHRNDKFGLNAYRLVACIENCQTKELLFEGHNDSTSNGITLRFSHDNSEDEGSIRVYDYKVIDNISDQYFSLNATIKKNVFEDGDNIRIIVEAIPYVDELYDVIFGASEVISVMNLALKVENRYKENEFVTAVDECTFAWFKNSKFGESNMLSVVMQVKDENGKNYKGELPHLKFSTELLYEDDSPVPLHPLNPLNNSQRENPIMTFRKMRGEPRYSSNNKPVRFWFRIEEVIFHHSSHKGFKLNICAKTEEKFPKIHSSPMNEVIVVLSKPRSNATNLSRTEEITETIEPPLKIKRRDSEDAFSPPQRQMIEDDDLSEEFLDIIDVNSPESISKDAFAVIPVSALIDSYRCLDLCFCCNNSIAIDSFLLPKLHTERCSFANEVLPLLLLMGVNTDSVSVNKNKDINKSSKTAAISDNIQKHTSLDDQYVNTQELHDMNQHFTVESKIHVSAPSDSKNSYVSYNTDNITNGNITNVTPAPRMGRQNMMFHLNKVEEHILTKTGTPSPIANMHVSAHQHPFEAGRQNVVHISHSGLWQSFNHKPIAINQHYYIRSQQCKMSDSCAQPLTPVLSSSLSKFQTHQHRSTPQNQKKAYYPNTTNHRQTGFLWNETVHGHNFTELERRADNIASSVKPRRASLDNNNINDDFKISPIPFNPRQNQNISNVERLKKQLLELEEM